ncbi:MAG: tRNA-dihydrouridine synthase family protein [SAR324 cluster bacterium]|nr:tRNA-dihydrouridine synthase family protein [SAR324 cluster bacterium]MCZ6557232.1 tRNA-dihydrouridine synthase family protein [SAR324 cluster bacterium]MCZ6626999.1 tRNA-dihydrouridine synthase family protein [SAR324 cluster bacterium]MCZ6645362.1 tRNA-dihydrouridine synthase family protein [SAR324 cluster bacterium]
MVLKWAEMARPIVCLAPMDGITDSAFRQLVRRFNRDVVLFSEFTSADGFLRSEKVRSRLSFTAEEHPYFVQLFGNNAAAFAEASRALEQEGVAGIDINMGCPARKIVASQHGSGLMRDVNQACRMVEAVASACSLEVSVKTRLGWRDSSVLAPFTRSLVSAGASLITIHGRTYDQGFKGKADWAPIRDLKRELSVPVLGNGDVVSLEDGRSRLGGLDGFMIGRAAIGNPWVFCNDEGERQPSLNERVRVIRTHYQLMAQQKNRWQALREFRKHLAGYLNGISHIKATRTALMTAPDEGCFLHLLDALEERAYPIAQAG